MKMKCSKYLLVSVMIALPCLLSGCSRQEKTLGGILLGVGTGALVGGVAGGAGGAVAGGAIGGIAGGLIGNSVGDDD